MYQHVAFNILFLMQQHKYTYSSLISCQLILELIYVSLFIFLIVQQ